MDGITGITKYRTNKSDKPFREKSKIKKVESSNNKKYRKKQKWV